MIKEILNALSLIIPALKPSPEVAKQRAERKRIKNKTRELRHKIKQKRLEDKLQKKYDS